MLYQIHTQSRVFDTRIRHAEKPPANLNRLPQEELLRS